MNILVIGSKGFIGSHTLRYFSKKPEIYCFGADIVLDNISERYFPIDDINCDYTAIFKEVRFDFCINCSGAANVPASMLHPLKDFSLNTYNVIKLLDAIRIYAPDCKFINLSSAAIYGNPKMLPIKETDIYAPVSPYGFHKKYAEEILTEFYKIFRIRSCSLRIFSAYGIGLKKQLLWDISQKAMTQQHIELFGTGKETRDFINIEDILQCLNIIINDGKFEAEAYNIGNGVQVNIQQIAECLLKELNFEGMLKFSGHEREGDPLYWVADIEKIKSIGYVQKISIEEGIKKYAGWINDLK
jgi:UDP-glucose 4-epimerase